MNSIGNFIKEHWGDFIALHLIYLGVALLLYNHADGMMIGVGNGFIMTGLGTLRFKGILAPNGGNNGSTTQTHTETISSRSTPVAPAVLASADPGIKP